ncbi:MAG: ABC transporter permease, partial [Candidatus Hodarchaeota archaeon]
MLTEPGKEPMFSTVPTYLAEDILQLDGVTAVSPETVDFCYHVDKNQPLFVRGVTDEFRKVLDTYRIHSGRWLNFTSGAMEAVAGKRYADKMGLHSGQFILLASRRTDFLISVPVVGIIESNTNADDSILLPLWLGQMISLYSTTEVKLMRIRFDHSISAKTIRDIVNSEFQITVELLRYNSTSFDPNGTIVRVYDRNHLEIKSMTYPANQETITFLLPFGTYSFVANPPEIRESHPVSVLVDRDGWLQLYVGTRNFTLTVDVSHNGETAAAAYITAFSEETNRSYTKMTNEEGNLSLDLPEGIYSLRTNYFGTENQTSISLYTSFAIQINLFTALQVTVLNATTIHPLPGVNLTVFDENDSLKGFAITNNDGKAYLECQPGPTALNVSWAGFERVEHLTLSGFTERNLTLGHVNAIVNVIHRGQGPVDNALVEVKRAGIAIENTTTDSSGVV